MEIILLERVEKLGQMGDRVRVKNGYARNYLLPKGKALRVTAQNIERFGRERATLEADNLENGAGYRGGDFSKRRANQTPAGHARLDD